MSRELGLRTPRIDRSFERRIVVAGVLVAAAYLVAAVATIALPAPDRRGAWLPLHLALAGGASSAIAAVMPFFVAAFAAVPPADPRLRSVALALVASGALVIVTGVLATSPVAALGGLVYITGIAVTGIAIVRPVRGSLGPSRGLVTQAYVVALVHVGLGATLATLVLAGWPPVTAAWGSGKPTHAWLNLIGFVSLVIATTLLHFFPTVAGTRIGSGWTARGTVVGIGGGAFVAALGTLVGTWPLAVVGAAGVAAGALCLALYAARIWRARGRWTTDLEWHRFSIGGLISGIAWFCAGAAILLTRTLVEGASPVAWSTTAVAGPLVVGWMGITFLASASHLLPAVGPGSPAAHAAQRHILGRAARPRLVVLDLGCLGVTAGLVLSVDGATLGGIALTALGAASTVALLVAAIAAGRRESRGSP